jgi:hypothetical protein
MEQRFSHDFSSVRVHTDATADRSARDVHAHAYTVGSDIIFGAGRFVPGTQDGRQLIAHELTHVVQQSGSEGVATQSHTTATVMRAITTSRAVEAVRGPGTSLPKEIQRAATRRYGQSFANVRIHTGAPASAAAASLSASAFTIGNNIAFGAHRYAPATTQGRLLLQHELRHVAQQRSAAPAVSPELDSPKSQYEQEARQIHDPHIEALPVQRIQCAPDDESSFGDSLVEGIGQGLFGAGTWSGLKEVAKFATADQWGRVFFGRAWPFLKALFEGFLDGFQADVDSGRAESAEEHLVDLVLNPGNSARFLGGFLIGVVLGLISPITDLVKGVIAIVEFGQSAVEWLAKWSPAGIAASHERQQKIVRLTQKFADLKDEFGKALDSFRSDPKKTVEKFSGFLDDLMQMALGKAHEFGANAAHSIFNFLNSSYYEMGKGIGELVGALLAQILLFIFTGPIGKLITELASSLGKVAKFALGKAVGVFKWVKDAGSEVVSLLRKAAKGALKFFEGLVTKTIEAYDALAEIFSEAASIELAVEKGAAGAGRNVLNVYKVTSKEAAILEHTAAKIVLEPTEAMAELDIAKHAGATPGHPMELPNHHTIEPHLDGTFCRTTFRICYDKNGKPLPESIEQFRQRGGKVERRAVPIDAQPKPGVTAAPKSGPRPPEGFEDIFEQVSERKTLGTKPVSSETQAGTFAHEHFKNLDNMLSEFNKDAAKYLDDYPKGKRIKREYKIEHPEYKGREPRVDLVDEETAEVFEIKPRTKEWIKKGKAQAQQYVEWLNKYHKRSDGKIWKLGKGGGVLTYDQDVLLAWLRDIGYFPK